MERLVKDVQSMKAQITDIRGKYDLLIKILEEKDIIENREKK